MILAYPVPIEWTAWGVHLRSRCLSICSSVADKVLGVSEMHAGPLLEVRWVGDVMVARFCTARLTREATDQLTELVKKGVSKVALDCAAVEFVASAALSRLLTLDKRLREINGGLKLFGITAEVEELFLVTSLNHVFDIYATEKDALEAFANVKPQTRH